MLIFGPKPWVHQFGKMSIFPFFELLVFIAQEGVFLVQNIVKDIFLAYITSKGKVEKWPFLKLKPWVNPFGKMSIFRLFEVLVFIAQKGVFWFQNIVKVIFLAYIVTTEKVKKWPFLDQNHGLTPSEKCQFFDVLNFLLLQPRQAFFFFSRIS